MEEKKLALKVDDKDNVATIFANGIVDGTQVEIRDKKGVTEPVRVIGDVPYAEVESRDKKGVTEPVRVIGDVPYGHKIAVREIRQGEAIMKYGESIGAASADIRKGEYVHSHNMVAMRGRGDL